ncbi:hypothetical protein BV22DRAFT_1108077 [Leucogyrophana mollusca]|uniref:Uncharacterized protein n=1 Tax=Leucogyrophana mollusca TaxID=85980 RepID=A0ACB8B2V3_9AGAM|nr:hypothetical protein BV22DRAFT_1108077 [Leucogyrophana mollusca]
MRINGSTLPETTLDDETLSILLRRLHPRIAAYNEVVIFLLKCNMDLKFIGSGEAAKALIFYVTDYVTKPALPAYIGLAALASAIEKTNERTNTARSQETVENPGRRALTMAVNSMISRLEMSHPQIMSYLLGGGDYYRSHSFQSATGRS